ncbi:MAG: hypothetical protein Q7T71_20785 [Herbiconiux sp.]|nr:hypothetical protein [Herbiconiux sp.]
MSNVHDQSVDDLLWELDVTTVRRPAATASGDPAGPVMPAPVSAPTSARSSAHPPRRDAHRALASRAVRIFLGGALVTAPAALFVTALAIR